MDSNTSQTETSLPAASPCGFHWRRLVQFRLRTLLIVAASAALGMGCWTLSAHWQRKAIAAIEKQGGHVYLRGSLGNTDWAQFLQRLTPRDYQFYAYEAGLDSATDAEMEHFYRLDALESLYLPQSRLTDVGLERLGSLRRLRLLNLAQSKLDDAGLKKLERLSDLGVLFLNGTQVTDAGLIHLEQCSHLVILHLYGTQVTDAGVARLRRALPNCDIRH